MQQVSHCRLFNGLRVCVTNPIPTSSFAVLLGRTLNPRLLPRWTGSNNLSSVMCQWLNRGFYEALLGRCEGAGEVLGKRCTRTRKCRTVIHYLTDVY